MTLEARSARADRESAAGASVDGRSIDLGTVEAIPVGEGRTYCIGGKTVAVFRPRDGRLYALDNRCPHRAGPLADGIVGGGAVICPLHGWKFDLASGQCLNDSARVQSYPVVLVDGRMILLLEGDG